MDAGYREITLTGVDIGHYGRDLAPRTSLAALIARLGEVPGLRWLRLSSVLPAYWSDGADRGGHGHRARWHPHLHLPLQSGSDRVLRLMRRPYNTADVPRARGAARRARSPTSASAPTSSWAIPGEDDDDFAATLRVVEELPLSYLHVFPYSDRKRDRGGARRGVTWRRR